MGKPADIPLNVWDDAYTALSETKHWRCDRGVGLCNCPRGRWLALSSLQPPLNERLCLKLASEHAQPGYTDFVDGFNVACVQIAEAIRYRVKGA